MPEETQAPPRGEFLTSIRAPSIEYGWDDIIEFRFAVRDSNTGKTHIAQPLVFKERDGDENAYDRSIGAPAFAICTKTADGQKTLRRIMDQLWALGIRPTDMGSPSQIAATEKHLGDMRAITGKLMDVKLPA